MSCESSKPTVVVDIMPFRAVESFRVGSILIETFVSEATGLRVVVANCLTPLVNGYFTLATESHSDDGCPHCLEHLIFLGSEQYPYKGVLDSLATRCLCNGTNAWTAIDHTAYTVTTAGSVGFLNLMPVYLDHILYPTLTDAAFRTEVHHITGEGQNAGVVYCEMQGRENTADSRVELALLRAMYGNGPCGYKSETGGLMCDLRTLTNETVRAYHRSYYRPDNLSLIITGPVNAAEVLAALQPFEDRIVAKGPLSPMQRPWQQPVPPPSNSNIVQRILFPSDDEEVGQVAIGYRGPVYADLLTREALNILMLYLTDTAVAPLQKTFCEPEEGQPLCGDISFTIHEQSECAFVLEFRDVPTESLASIASTLHATMSTMLELDMARMHRVISLERRRFIEQQESSPDDFVSQNRAITHFLYGNDDTLSLQAHFAVTDRLDQLMQLSMSYWSALISKFMVNAVYVAIEAEPSRACSEELRTTDEKRIAAQIEALGTAGLAAMADELSAAQAANAPEVPLSMQEALPIPDLASVSLIPVQSVSNTGTFSQCALSTEQEQQLASLPFSLHVINIPSAFVRLSCVLDCSVLTAQQQLLVPLLLEAWFESPVIRDGVTWSHSQVIDALQTDTVDYGARFYSIGQCCNLRLTMEASRYTDAIAWLRDIIFNTEFSADRLLVVAQRLLAAAPAAARNGSQVVRSLATELNFQPSFLGRARAAHRQRVFLRRLVRRLGGSGKVEEQAEEDGDSQSDDQSDDQEHDDSEDSGSDESDESEELEVDDDVQVEPAAVCAEINQVREMLTRLSAIRVSVALDIGKQDNLMQAWNSFVPAAQASSSRPLSMSPPLSHHALASPIPTSRSLVLSSAALESNFVVQSTRGQFGWTNPSTEACELVAIELLTTIEGPFWKGIRGAGLSYGYSLFASRDSGLLQFSLYRATDVLKALETAKQLIQDYASGKKSFDSIALQAAKSSVLFEILSEAGQSLADAAYSANVNFVCGIAPQHTSELLKAVQNVSSSDVATSLSHISRLFDAKQSHCVVCAAPTASAAISAFLHEQCHFDDVTHTADAGEIFA